LSDEKIELSSEFTDTDFEFKTGGSSEKGNQTMNTIFPSDNRMTADEQKKIVEKWAFFDKVDLDKRKAENMERAAVIRMQEAKEARAREDKAHKKLEAENAVAESKAKAAKDADEAARKRLASEDAKAAEAKKRADAADKIKTDASEAAVKIKKDALAARIAAGAKSAATAKLKAPEAAAAKPKADIAAKSAETLRKGKTSAANLNGTQVDILPKSLPETSFTSLRPYLTNLNLWSPNYAKDASSLLEMIHKSCKKSAKCALTKLDEPSYKKIWSTIASNQTRAACRSAIAKPAECAKASGKKLRQLEFRLAGVAPPMRGPIPGPTIPTLQPKNCLLQRQSITI
jgi:hypothetical protein